MFFYLKKNKKTIILFLEWSEWSNWSQCSRSCGEGSRIRTRVCQGYGKPCVCDIEDKSLCFSQPKKCEFDSQDEPCPSIDGSWVRER